MEEKVRKWQICWLMHLGNTDLTIFLNPHGALVQFWKVAIDRNPFPYWRDPLNGRNTQELQEEIIR